VVVQPLVVEPLVVEPLVVEPLVVEPLVVERWELCLLASSLAIAVLVLAGDLATTAESQQRN